MLLIPVISNLNFQLPLIQTSVSHDPSEVIQICWYGDQETVLIIINANSCVALYFCEKKKQDTFLSFLQV